MVDPVDNPKQSALTFRTWLLGVSSCVLLSFINQFFGFRKNTLYISSVCVQIVTLPIGRFLAVTLPKKDIKLPFTNWAFSLNPGSFTMKEHCLIAIFAGTGADGVYSVHIVTVVKAFYHRKINLRAAFSCLVMVGLVFSENSWLNLHICGGQQTLFKSPSSSIKFTNLSVMDIQFQFFIIVFIASFAYYVIPGFIFPAISAISFICLVYKNSVTMQQIGSGLNGLGIGSFGLDWSTVAGFLGSPLATPSMAIFNIMISFFLKIYVLLPITYWTNTYNAKRFPMISSNVFDSSGNIFSTPKLFFFSSYHAKESPLAFSLLSRFVSRIAMPPSRINRTTASLRYKIASRHSTRPTSPSPIVLFQNLCRPPPVFPSCSRARIHCDTVAIGASWGSNDGIVT